VDALEERVEIEAVTADVRNDDLTVDDASLGQCCSERVEQLGEVAVERSQLATPQFESITVTKNETPEAVPLRFEQPSIAVGNGPGQLGQHRLHRGLEREIEIHVESVAHSVQRPSLS
jgi:hypothetical protein